MAKGTCSLPGCEEPVEARGLCRRDYGIAWRARDLPAQQLELELEFKPVHRLSNVNRENRLADCAVCGPGARIYVRTRERPNRGLGGFVEVGCLGGRKPRPRKPPRPAKPAEEGQRWHKLRLKYKLTQDEYERLAEAQEWRCALCGVHEQELPKRRLLVDHDHETGRVRGLLCRPCNFALGFFRDNTEAIAKAVIYLAG